MTKTKPVPIGIRVPPDMAEWLRQQAAANQRSLSNQTVWTLKQFRIQQDAKVLEVHA